MSSKRMTLTAKELELVEEWKGVGVLAPIEPDLLPVGTGIILVSCGDCHQIHEILAHQRGLWQKKLPINEVEALVHTLTINAGGLRLVAGSILNRGLPTDEIFMQEITDSRFLKKIDTIGLLAHAPCGAARSCAMDLEKILEDLFQAKFRVKERHPDAKVLVYLHVDHDGGTKCRTYVAKYPTWQWWRDHKKN